MSAATDEITKRAHNALTDIIVMIISRVSLAQNHSDPSSVRPFFLVLVKKNMSGQDDDWAYIVIVEDS